MGLPKRIESEVVSTSDTTSSPEQEFDYHNTDGTTLAKTGASTTTLVAMTVILLVAATTLWAAQRKRIS